MTVRPLWGLGSFSPLSEEAISRRRYRKDLVVTIAGGIPGGDRGRNHDSACNTTSDHLVRIIFTRVPAYASFLLAERFHFSGVLASLTAEMIIGNIGPLARYLARKRIGYAYWEFLGFLPNALIFMGIGIHLSRQNFAAALVPALIAIPLVILARAFAVYPCCAVFGRSTLRVKSLHQHILFWGGLRGALALALAVGVAASVPHQK